MYICKNKNTTSSIMATITLKYDGRNKTIKKLIEVILSLGAQIEPKGYEATLKACKDADNGKLIEYKDIDDFKKKMYAL